MTRVLQNNRCISIRNMRKTFARNMSIKNYCEVTSCGHKTFFCDIWEFCAILECFHLCIFNSQFQFTQFEG